MSIKVLVISSNAFSKFLNNGKTYEALFKGWVPEDLAQLYFSSIEIPDFSFCNNYYNITEIDVIKSLVSLNMFKAGKKIDNVNNDKSEPYLKKENFIIRWLKRNSKKISFFRYLLWKTNLWKNSNLTKWLHEYNPDVIFFIAGDVAIVHDIVKWISKKMNLPYLVYFTDDYIINKYKNGFFGYLYNKILEQKYKYTINNAEKCYAIGEIMSYEYSKLFNKNFDVLINCIDFQNITTHDKKVLDKGRIIISYIGGLHLNRWKTLVELGELFSLINNRYSINCSINLYAIQNPTPSELELLNKSPLAFKGALNNKEIAEVVNNSDFLVHVESFDETSRAQTQFSISTKIPEYLSSNRPIIVYGPSEVASIRLINENKLGLVLTELDNKEDIIRKIMNLINDANLRDLMIDRAFNYAREHFNAAKMRNMLRNDINDIVYTH